MNVLEKAAEVAGKLPTPLIAFAQAMLRDDGAAEAQIGFFFQSRSIAADAAAGIAAFGGYLAAAGRRASALTALDAALALRPDLPDAHNNRGVVLFDLRRLDSALASFNLVVALTPDFVPGWTNRANTLRELGRSQDALADLDRAIALKPDHVEALVIRALLLSEFQRFDEAIAGYEAALALQPDHRGAFEGLLHCKSRICDWRGREALLAQARTRILTGAGTPAPFVALRYFDDGDLLLRCAQAASRAAGPLAAPYVLERSPRADGRLRIAYLSADFRAHAMSHLMSHLIETHDRSRFEIIAVSHGPDDSSPLGRRMRAAFDRWIDIRPLNREATDRALFDLQIDIAVDAMGYTPGYRPGLLARRPAPVQVNYLGYAGTMGADWMDYIIADRIVAPPEHAAHFQERIVWLDDAYQPNEPNFVHGKIPGRAAVGLPETGFVFCCFNSNLKIGPETFAIWMRLLQAVDGAVLWLLEDNPATARNLRAAAAAAGIDPARLIFAPRGPLDQHLSRQRCADLFIDTLPYGAHTTASDALWAGLPLLAHMGPSFAGRVAASLVTTAGLPEMIVTSLADYESTALDLARNPTRLAAIRSKLARREGPMFDAARYRRSLEAAYEGMWERWRRGEKPESFAARGE